MIEHEVKYVIDIEGLSNIFDYMAELKSQVLIEQVYHKNGARFRKGVDGKCHFNYKIPMGDNKSLEFETEISHIEYMEAAAYCHRKLTKRRAFMQNVDNVTSFHDQEWVVDVFMNEEGPYFVLAECEMRSIDDSPSGMPAFIKDHLLYQVPADDNRFTSYKLSDDQYAKSLYEEVMLNL